MTFSKSAGTCAKSFQSCLTLCNAMDCSLPGFSVHGILQARIQEWVAVPFSRGSFGTRNWTQASTLQADSLLYESQEYPRSNLILRNRHLKYLIISPIVIFQVCSHSSTHLSIQKCNKYHHKIERITFVQQILNLSLQISRGSSTTFLGVFCQKSAALTLYAG